MTTAPTSHSAADRPPESSRAAAGRFPRLRLYGRLLLVQLFAVRAWLLALGHVLAFAFAYWLAHAVRFDFALPTYEVELIRASLPIVLLGKAFIFYALGQYSGWWRYVTFADVLALLRASLLSLAFVGTVSYLIPALHVPRGVVCLDFVFTVVILGAARSSFRVFREQFLPMAKPKDSRWALLVGTDDDTCLLAHRIASEPTVPYRVRGLLEVNGQAQSGQKGQMPILGHVNRLAEVASHWQATEVLVTAGALPSQQIRDLMDACRRADLNLKIIPSVEDRLDGHRRIPIRDIEINDLLRRPPVELDCQAISRLIAGRTVLVTGAGGSIGSEICRQALKFRPRKLILLGRGENRVFFLEQELRETLRAHLAAEAERPDSRCAEDSQITFVSRIVDIRDLLALRRVFEEQQPEVVFHAAAHKHVPLMEEHPGEAVKNNVLGTRNVADLAHASGVASFVLISTDKAVRPSSVMGATKQLAEQYVMALSRESRTRFVATRFGNVLGSAGSVVPIFQEQIRRGGPITVTDPNMTRYFMTIPEASQLVLQAAAMGSGGEIFVLEMGAPVKIVDLARDLIRLSGLPEHAIDISYTGVRPGEKLHEELYVAEEETLPTANKKLRVARSRPIDLADISRVLSDLASHSDGSAETVRSRLQAILPEFRPIFASPCARSVEVVGDTEPRPEQHPATLAATEQPFATPWPPSPGAGNVPA